MSYVTKSEIFLHSMREIDKWLLMSEIFTIKRAHEDCVKNLGIWVDQQCVKSKLKCGEMQHLQSKCDTLIIELCII